MAFCRNCGAEFSGEPKFCPKCGSATAPNESFGEKLGDLNNTADTTGAYDQVDIEQNKGMAVMAYIGILVLVPLLAAPKSKFARFHANQGLVLIIAGMVYGVAQSILHAILFAISWRLLFISTILGLVWIAYAVLAILGIVNAASGKAKELPVIGSITILK